MTTEKAKNWRDLARLARSRLAEPVAHGQKTALLAATAQGLGLTRGTLDNYLAALAAFDKMVLLAPELEKQLEAQSAAALSALGRWSDYDLSGLRQFLSQNPQPTLRQVLDAERHARLLQGSKDEQGFLALIEGIEQRSLRDLYWRRYGQVSKEISDALDRHLPYWFSGVQGNLRLEFLSFQKDLAEYQVAMGLDVLGVLDGKKLANFYQLTMHEEGHAPVTLIGVIEIARRERDEQYRREARGIWLRMIAASTIVPVVLVFYPDENARDVSIGNFPELPQFDERGEGKLSHPWLRRVNKWGGLALLTTPATLLDDWYGMEPGRY